MTAVREEAQKRKIKEREVWLETFSSPAGRTVLAQILNMLGMFSNVDKAIDPKLTAIGNEILLKLGVYEQENLGSLMDFYTEVGRISK